MNIIDQIADERDKAQQENKQLKDRIKRLEEAGDALANTQTYDLLETVNWRKSKEAKP